MTPTQLKEAAQVMVAASEGKQVQYRSAGQLKWVDLVDPSWDWSSTAYRIKPEPREWWMTDAKVCFESKHEAERYSAGHPIKVLEVI